MFLSMYMVRGSDSENYLSRLGWYFFAFYGIFSLSHYAHRLFLEQSQHLPDKKSFFYFKGEADFNGRV
jgi:hypothetical protein